MFYVCTERRFRLPRTILLRSRPDPRNSFLFLIIDEDFCFDLFICLGLLFLLIIAGFVGGGRGFVRRNFTRSSIDNDGKRSLESV